MATSATERILPDLGARLAALHSEAVQNSGGQRRYVIPLYNDQVDRFALREWYKRPVLAIGIVRRRQLAADRGWTLIGSYMVRHVTKTPRPQRAPQENRLGASVLNFFLPSLIADGGDPCDPYENISLGPAVMQDDDGCSTDEEDVEVDVYDDGNPDDVAWTEVDSGTTTGDDGETLVFFASVSVVADTTTVDTDPDDPDYGDIDLSFYDDDAPEVQAQAVGGGSWYDKYLKPSKTWHGMSCSDMVAIGRQIKKNAKEGAIIGAITGALAGLGMAAVPGAIIGAIDGGSSGYSGTVAYEDQDAILTCYTNLKGSSSPLPLSSEDKRPREQ